MAFTQKDLVDLCRQIIASADILDRAKVLKSALPAIEARSEQVARELADTLGALEQAKQAHATALREHGEALDQVRQARRDEQKGLEADRAARFKAKQDGQTWLLENHAALSAPLRNERDALAAEIASLKNQKAELQRALRDARDNVKV